MVDADLKNYKRLLEKISKLTNWIETWSLIEHYVVIRSM